jgi:CubicO group peptidase (beta-lactamase class C family)
MRRREFIERLGLGATAIAAGYALPSRAAAAATSTPRGRLPRSNPAEQGVSSASILRFLDAIPAAHLELHSFMLVRHGHVVAETWWSPYRSNAPHSLYSLSKSFTSTAVGFAVAEGRLKVTDKVASFFPDQLPQIVSDNLAALQIRHLLSMAVGHKTDSTATIVGNPAQPDWVKTFLSVPIEHAPGEVFLYDSGASFMLSAIVQKATGEKVADYLQPRLFAPLEIHEKPWDESPLGIDTGGWGLSVTTESLAKFGQLYLQKGEWNGQQLLAKSWVEEATSFKIQQAATWNSGSDPGGQADYLASLSDPVAALAKLKQSSDWYQGYAYQFWRCRHNAFRGDGAFGQLCVVMPDEDAVIAITSETGNIQGVLNLIWDHLLPAMSPGRIKDAKQAKRELTHALETRRLPLPPGQHSSPIADQVSGRRFVFDANPLGFVDGTLTFGPESCVVALNTANGAHQLTCGLASWVDGLIDLPGEPPALIPRKQSGSVKVAGAGAWSNEATFEVRWRFYETPHSDRLTFTFENDDVRVQFLNSITAALGASQALHPETRPALKGTLTAAG